MHLLDANIILRYLVGDGGDAAEKARHLIEEEGDCYTYPEVLAEVVYVLSGVYERPRSEICTAFRRLLDYMYFYDPEMLLTTFNLYETVNMDFVDCLLVARHACKGEPVASFDKRVQAQIRGL